MTALSEIAVSRDEGESLTVQTPRAVGSFPVCHSVKPVGEPNAIIGDVRVDERGWETERCHMAQAAAPILDSTKGDMYARSIFVSSFREASSPARRFHSLRATSPSSIGQSGIAGSGLGSVSFKGRLPGLPVSTFRRVGLGLPWRPESGWNSAWRDLR